MKTKLPNIVTLFYFLIVAVGCDKSENPVGEEKVEINDNSVESADVNAPDYWNNVELVWSDEFNGSSLDPGKWFLRLLYLLEVNCRLMSLMTILK